jgi:hypothetical protein
MRRSIVSLAGGLCASVLCCGTLPASEVPGALSSEGPALATFGSDLVVAWAGESGIGAHKVWYSTFNGSWAPEADIPGALTTTAPALGVADQRLFLATTPPQADDEIRYYVSDGAGFETNGATLCDPEGCAHTRAAPALIGDGATLYAAWTTPAGEIRYATRVNGAWSIAALPIPHVLTAATTGPAVAVFEQRLYVAWVLPSGEAVGVTSAALPLAQNSWSEQPVEVPVETQLAPALGVLTVTDPQPSPAAESTHALFLLWTTPNATLDFARWDPSAAQWAPVDSPVPLPSGPLTFVAPVLNGATSDSTTTTANDGPTPDAEVATGHGNVVAYTRPQHQICVPPLPLEERTGPCP